MAEADYADKITGLIAMGSWGAVAANAVEGSAVALLAEPVTGAVILGTALALQLKTARNDPCAKAIDAHRRQTEKAITKALGGNSRYREAVGRAFADFDHHIADIRPTGEDLVRLWQFDPQKIAEGLMARLEAKSETIRDHHVARQAVAQVIAGAVAAFRDDAALFAKLEPVLAREYLAQLGAIRSMGEDTNQVVHRSDAKLDALAEMVRALAEQAQSRGDTARAVDAGIDPGVIVTLAQRISADVQDFDQAFRELENAVSIAITVQREGAGGSNAGAFVDAVLKRVAALSAKGKFAAASKEAANAFAQWERDEAERQEASRQSGLKLLEAGWRQDLLAGDAKAAAAKIWQGVLLGEKDADRRFVALSAEIEKWHERGRDQGGNLELKVAIELAHRSVIDAKGKDWYGAALNDLGIVLSALGQRERNTSLLVLAASVFGEVLNELARARVPLDWAATQNNLGNVLSLLGERESSAARLEQALLAFEKALEERTRTRVPLQWAMTKNNIGNTLLAKGQLEDGTSRLEQAASAFEDALKEIPRAQLPLQWATTKSNLGNALLFWGQRESGRERLENAVSVYLEALEEHTRAYVPLQWANTAENLAFAYWALFDKTGERDHLRQALALVEDALEVYGAAQAVHYFESAQKSQSRILAKLGDPG